MGKGDSGCCANWKDVSWNFHLGMQMLASRGEEGGETKGLNLIPGSVIRLDKVGCSLRIPHVGWNEVIYNKESEIFSKIPNSSDFYFVHSFVFQMETNNNLLAVSPYDIGRNGCYSKG